MIRVALYSPSPGGLNPRLRLQVSCGLTERPRQLTSLSRKAAPSLSEMELMVSGDALRFLIVMISWLAAVRETAKPKSTRLGRASIERAELGPILAEATSTLVVSARETPFSST